MNNISSLYVDLSNILKMTDSDIPVDTVFPEAAFSEFSDICLCSPVILSGKIINLAGDLRIEAVLKFSAKHLCDRCLSSFVKDYELEFSDEIALDNSGRELDEYISYSNNRVLLTEAVYKCMFAEMGIKNVCRHDCKGLCGSCGKDLNSGECTCMDDYIDPRLLKLKDFLKK